MNVYPFSLIHFLEMGGYHFLIFDGHMAQGSNYISITFFHLCKPFFHLYPIKMKSLYRKLYFFCKRDVKVSFTQNLFFVIELNVKLNGI